MKEILVTVTLKRYHTVLYHKTNPRLISKPWTSFLDYDPKSAGDTPNLILRWLILLIGR